MQLSGKRKRHIKSTLSIFLNVTVIRDSQNFYFVLCEVSETQKASLQNNKGGILEKKKNNTQVLRRELDYKREEHGGGIRFRDLSSSVM